MLLVLLDYLAEALSSLNSSLLDSPPPGVEQSGQDVCYLTKNIGLSGDDSSIVTFCRDLNDGKRFAVGSWYISPRQHAIECFAVTILCLLLLYVAFPVLRRYHRASNVQPTIKSAIRPPFLMQLIAFIAVLFQLYYKAQGYAGKVYFWVMPCNMNWLLLFFVSFYPALSWEVSHSILQMCISFSALAIVAVLSPDTSDLVLPFELPFFFISHTILALYPFYFVATRQISMLPPSPSRKIASALPLPLYFAAWWCVTCSAFGLFYFGIVTPLSIYSGLNLNYMLSPPPIVLFEGPWYRLVSIVFISAIFFAMRFLTTVIERIAVIIFPARKKIE